MDDVRTFLARVPPAAAALRIERFKGHTVSSLVGDLMPLATDVSVDERPHGRRLIWADGAGAQLAKLVIHPARSDIEHTLLPMCFAAAAAVPAEVQLWCDSGTLLDPQRMMERWDPRDPIRAEDTLASLRDGELGPAQRRAGDALSRHGWKVRRAGETIEAERAWRKSASPWLLILLPLLLFFGLPLFVLRVWRGLFTQVGDLWRGATRGASSRIRYEISPMAIVVRASTDGIEQPPIEVPLERIGVLWFAPAGVAYADPHDGGSLRVIGTDGCTSLPHTALGFSRVSTVDTAKADREVGAALKDLIRATIGKL
jgi:hypothetical protein